MTTETAAPETNGTKKKWGISHKRLLAMNLSKEAQQEMIDKGIAEPAPDDQRLERVPTNYRAVVSELLKKAEGINAGAGRKIVGITIYSE